VYRAFEAENILVTTKVLIGVVAWLSKNKRSINRCTVFATIKISGLVNTLYYEARSKKHVGAGRVSSQTILVLLSQNQAAC
jgi:hypothetical protein